VGQADRRRRHVVGQRRAQVRELAGTLLDEHLVTGGYEGDAGRVVAAILEARQALQQDWGGLARPDVTDYSAHAR
jgi:hypothetical protein